MFQKRHLKCTLLHLRLLKQCNEEGDNMRYTLDINNKKLDGLRNVLDNGVATDAYAAAHVTFNDKCEVKGGLFEGGTFKGGVFKGGVFKGGTFYGGLFDDGTFYVGTFRGGWFGGGWFNGGLFSGGTFYGGEFEGGVFRGGWFGGGWFNGGLYEGGTFDVTTNPFKQEGYNMKDEKKGAERKNSGKAPLSMVLEANHALTGAAQVMAFGAKKYARGNWHKGLPHTEVADCLIRHLSAYLSGEDLDPESGLPHVDHVLCNAVFLAQLVRTHPELDDRSEELKK